MATDEEQSILTAISKSGNDILSNDLQQLHVPGSLTHPSISTNQFTQSTPRFCLAVDNVTIEHSQNPWCWNKSSPVDRVIENVSFLAKPGRVLAIVGSVGCGCSSLLNAIAGRIKINSGSICAIDMNEIANNNYYSRCCKRDKNVCFSFIGGGDDHLLANLTVLETLMFSAQLKLPELSKTERKKKVTLLLNRMNLISCRNVYVGSSECKGLSTGERRRLNIAIELLDTSKSLLLLNKPTTGVDSSQAREIIELLSDIAKAEEKTIIFSLDQPTSGIFENIDDVLLLCHGHAMFCGPVNSIVSYFENSLGIKMPGEMCSADFIIDGAHRLNQQKFNNCQQDVITTIQEEHQKNSTAWPNDNVGQEQRQSVAHWKTDFESSEYHESVRIQLDQIHNQSECQTYQLSSKNFEREMSAFHFFWTSVKVLSKRFLINRFRSSLCWGPLIFAIIQGLLMGSLMFQYPRQLPDPIIEPTEPLFPSGSISNTTLGRAFIDGSLSHLFTYNNHSSLNMPRGLEELLDLGVHSMNTSNPLITLNVANHQTKEFIEKVRSGISCLYNIWVAPNTNNVSPSPRDDKNYPYNLNKTDTFLGQSIAKGSKLWAIAFPSKNAKNLTIPNSISVVNNIEYSATFTTTDFGAILQLADHLWNKRNWTEIERCKNNYIGDFQYQCLYEKFGLFVFDITTCLKMPLIPKSIRNMFNVPKEPPLRSPSRLNNSKGTDGSLLGSTQGSQRNIVLESHTKFFENLFKSDDNLNLNYPLDKYDEAIGHWNPDVSKKEWKRAKEIIHDLLPGVTVMDALKLVLNPKIKDDSSILVENDGMTNLLKFVARTWNYISTKDIDLVQWSTMLSSETYKWFPIPLPQLDNCASDSCQQLKLLLTMGKRRISRFINRIKINLIQREFPRITVSAWTVLTVTGCLFATVATLGFFCFDTLLTFHKDRVLFNREVANGSYRPLAFFIGKNIADIPFQFSLGLIVSFIIGIMSGVAPTVSQFRIYLTVSSLVCFAAYGFCYMISAATPRMEVAIVLAPFMLITWLILAGFIMRSDSLIPKGILWYRYIGLHRFGWFAVMSNTFPENHHFGSIPNNLTHWLMGLKDTNIGKMIGLLLALGTGFRIFGYLLLKFFYRRVGLVQH